MPRSDDDDDLTRFLVRAVLDPEFCALVRRAPDEAFDGYDLSDDDKETLRRGDEGVLRLLGLALRGGAAGATDEGPGMTTPAEPSAPAAPAPVPMQPISLLLTVQPYALSTPEGIQMTLSASIAPAPLPAAPPAAAAEPPTADPGSGGSPWEHDLDSERTRDAAAAVRDSSPAERRERILALLAAMTASEIVGGDGDGAPA